MRAIPEGLKARLAAGATTLCRCWLVERQDGAAYGFTDHDNDIAFEGHVFRANSGLEAGAIESAVGLNVDNSQAVGALTSDGITEADIAAGRFDRALVRHWLVDWRAPDNRIEMFKGRLGEITRGDGAFEVELRGLSEDLNRTVGRSILPTCDRTLGDAKCRFDTATPGYILTATVSEVLGRRKISVYGASAFAARWFEFGALQWTSGANAGTGAVVKFDQPKAPYREIEFWQDAPHPIEKGDAFTLRAGCDKTATACREKFRNFDNFRGFPHVPGDDWAIAYPANDGLHDGSKLTSD